MRILTIASGVMLILTGLWCFINQGVAFSALAFILGMVMVIYGLVGAFAFLKLKSKRGNTGWVLAEAILAVILGCIVLADQLATDLMIMMFFGMWLLFSGCNRLVGALAIKGQNDKTWTWTAGLSGLSILAGIYSFLNPVLADLTLGLMIGIMFMIQGINGLSLGITMPHARKIRHRRRERSVGREQSKNE